MGSGGGMSNLMKLGLVTPARKALKDTEKKDVFALQPNLAIVKKIYEKQVYIFKVFLILHNEAVLVALWKDRYFL